MKRLGAMVLLVATFGIPAMGVVPGAVEDFSGSTADWGLMDILNWSDQSQYLSNEDGSASVTFKAQTVSSPAARLIYADLDASGGAFAGDYTIASAIRFKLYSETIRAGHVRVYLKSGNAWWYLPVDTSGLSVGAAPTVVEAPLNYTAGWRQGVGDSASAFNAALSNVELLGVYVERSSGTGAETYRVDDVEVEGVGAVAISGSISYNGEQSGAIRVLATAGQYEWDATYSAVTSAGGSYTLDGVPALLSMWVKAYLDSNGNSEYEFWEAIGWLDESAPTDRLVSDVSGANIVLSDPRTAEGLPYWWLREYFGIESAEGAAGAGVTGSGDPDGDGKDTRAEYVQGTNPTEADAFLVYVDGTPTLRWEQKASRQYQVLRADAADGEYTAVSDWLETDQFPVELDPDNPAFFKVAVDLVP